MSTLVDAPARVDGVQLIGETVGSGYRTPPSLVSRADGQVLQLTPVLYLVLSAVDGKRSYADIASFVGGALGRPMSPDLARSVIDGHLRPLGLVRLEDGSEPELRRANPLLRLKPRVAVTDPLTTRRLTDPFRVLFRAEVVGVVMLAFVAVVAWVFFRQGLGPSAYDAFERPHLLLLVFVVTVLSGGFHEFGHAAAARYGGAQPGTMGMGLYLVWPAFYTDVTDSYRLSRAGRIRTDLGGLYFNAVVVVVTFVAWWTTGWDALLLLVATQVLQMVQQLLPLLRFDGYHVLADLAGVPDLYHRIRPTLLGLFPHRWRSPENRVLRPGARAIITLWVLVTVPMMILMLLGVVAAVPRLLGTAGSTVQDDLAAVRGAWAEGSTLDVAADTLQVLGVVLPVLACSMVLGRIGLRFFGGLLRWSDGAPGRRVIAAVVSAGVVTGLSWAWWPHPGSYEPIRPGERGLFASLLTSPSKDGPAQAPAGLQRAGALTPGTAAQQRLSSGRSLVATFQEDADLPTRDHPVLATVLVPTGGSAGASTDITPSSTPSPGAAEEDAWVFPFDMPLPPEAGDNQALAVNTSDDSVVYDVAFALVWVDGDEALNVNEAHAYASCSDCVTVAVAFQVVLVMDGAQVVVPQNLAVAANYDCYGCITAAIARQLVLSVPGEPGEEQLVALAEVWNQLLQFAGEITSLSLDQVSAQLETFQNQIITILTGPPSAGATPSGTPTVSEAEASGSTAATATSTATATATATAAPSSSASVPTTPEQQEPSAEPAPDSTTPETSAPSAVTTPGTGDSSAAGETPSGTGTP